MSVDSVRLPQKQPVLRTVPMPADLNQNGDVFGGWVMAQVDVAGAIPAMRRASGRVATVSVNSFLFKQPISVGDVVSLYAEVVHVGNTSITVNVKVYAERNYCKPVTVKVTEAQLTYVAIDHNGQKRVVPPEKSRIGGVVNITCMERSQQMKKQLCAFCRRLSRRPFPVLRRRPASSSGSRTPAAFPPPTPVPRRSPTTPARPSTIRPA